MGRRGAGLTAARRASARTSPRRPDALPRRLKPGRRRASLGPMSKRKKNRPTLGTDKRLLVLAGLTFALILALFVLADLNY